MYPAQAAAFPVVDDFEAGLPQGMDGNGISVGFATFNDPNSSVAISTTAAPPAPVPGAADPNTVVDGATALYEPVANRHANHILDVSVYPAPVSTSTRNAAHEIARAVLEGLEVIGVLCVEMFELQDGSLVVNELAPRPHNSGHLTMDAHVCSQFEQQVRAVCGLPLGSTAARAPAAAMANLLGDIWSHGEPDWAAALATPGLQLHLYGKEDPRTGRKMGHMTVPGADPATTERTVLAAREKRRQERPL